MVLIRKEQKNAAKKKCGGGEKNGDAEKKCAMSEKKMSQVRKKNRGGRPSFDRTKPHGGVCRGGG